MAGWNHDNDVSSCTLKALSMPQPFTRCSSLMNETASVTLSENSSLDTIEEGDDDDNNHNNNKRQEKHDAVLIEDGFNDLSGTSRSNRVAVCTDSNSSDNEEDLTFASFFLNKLNDPHGKKQGLFQRWSQQDYYRSNKKHRNTSTLLTAFIVMSVLLMTTALTTNMIRRVVSTGTTTNASFAVPSAVKKNWRRFLRKDASLVSQRAQRATRKRFVARIHQAHRVELVQQTVDSLLQQCPPSLLKQIVVDWDSDLPPPLTLQQQAQSQTDNGTDRVVLEQSTTSKRLGTDAVLMLREGIVVEDCRDIERGMLD